MGHRPENACSCISISIRPSTPSEGEALSRIFHSPSEGAQMGHRPENACSRVSISSMLLPPSEGEALSRIFHSPSEGAQIGHRTRTPVAAFPSPPDLTHLPKVRHFPAFSAHLPKVRRYTTAARAPYSRVSLSIRPVPPSEGEALSRIFRSPSEGAQMRHRRQTTIQPRFPFHQVSPTFRR